MGMREISKLAIVDVSEVVHFITTQYLNGAELSVSTSFP
jgi:hypothetical protein